MKDEFDRENNVVQVVERKIGERDEIERRQKRHPMGPAIKTGDTPYIMGFFKFGHGCWAFKTGYFLVKIYYHF